jgi:demethylmenaquinone methyltransferase/2-methoxy-6-polyprenyl-1,4-benzoquinol methylase
VSGTDDEHALLADQVAYYRARAPEYDRTAYGSDLALARPPVPAEVRLQVVDVLRDDPPWSPTERFDAVLMAFWLSHVPRSQAMPFLDRVRSWLVPGGRLLVVDEPVGADTHERYDDARADVALRATTDGTTHRLFKVYLDPEGLTASLSERGWRVGWQMDEGWLTLQMTKDPS